MKTAVSLPDDLFAQAESEAKRRGVSRSEFYALAISDFVERQRSNSVTERLNQVYSEVSSELDPVLLRMQMLSLPKGEW